MPLSVTVDELDRWMDKSRMARNGTYGRVRLALRDYQNPANPLAKDKILERVDLLATDWLNRHGADPDPTAQGRAAVLRRLCEEVPRERAERDRARILELWKGQVAGARKPARRWETDPAKRHALQALTSTGALANKGVLSANAQALIATYGLTTAEARAVQVYTAQDYRYINPAAAGSKTWLADVQGDETLHVAHIGLDVLSEEGRTWMAFITSGLRKLPKTNDTTYRGVRYTYGAFAAAFLDQQGRPKPTWRVPSPLSTSTARSVAEKFAAGISQTNTLSDKHRVAAVMTFTRPGGCDVGALSQVKGENEVTIIPGTSFAIKGITNETSEMPSRYGELMTRARAMHKGQKDPEVWVNIQLEGPVPSPVAGGRAR